MKKSFLALVSLRFHAISSVGVIVENILRDYAKFIYEFANLREFVAYNSFSILFPIKSKCAVVSP